MKYNEKNLDRIRYIRDQTRQSSLYVIGVPEQKGKGQKKYLEK